MRSTPFFPFLSRLRRLTISRACCCALLLLWLKTFAPQAKAVPPIEFPSASRLVIVGGGLADILVQEGFLETDLWEAFPERQLAVRSLAVPRARLPEADSHGALLLEKQLASLDAELVFAFFGTNEALSESPSWGRFEANLRAFTNRVLSTKTASGRSMRLVLLGPIPQEPAALESADADHSRNEKLKRASDIMANVAAELALPFVDLFSLGESLLATRQQRSALLPKRWGTAQSALTIHENLPTTETSRHLSDAIFEALAGTPAPSTPRGGSIRKLVVAKQLAWKNDLLRLPVDVSPDALAPLEQRAAQMDVAIRLRFAESTTVSPSESSRPESSSSELERSSTVQLNHPEGQPFASSTKFPELTEPTQVAWDASGRLWVLCRNAGNGRLLVLDDTDGDGTADVCTVFATDLGKVDDFVFYRDGVLLLADDEIRLLRAPQQLGRIEQQERVLNGLAVADANGESRRITLDPTGLLLVKTGSARASYLETPAGTVELPPGAKCRFDPLTGRVEAVDAQRPSTSSVEGGFPSPNFTQTNETTFALTQNRPAQALPVLDQQSVPQLLELLKSEEPYRLQHVRNALATHAPEEVLPVLRAWAAALPSKESTTDLYRLQALWLSRWFGVLDPDLLEAALHAENAAVRVEAVHLVRDDQAHLKNALGLLASLADDADARIRIEVLRAAGSFAPHQREAVALVHRVLASPRDAELERVAWEVLSALEPDPSRLLLPEDASVRRFVLSGLSNEKLMQAPAVEAVWIEQIQREGLPQTTFDSALDALVALHHSNRPAEIAAALLRLDTADSADSAGKGVVEKLQSLLLQTPVSELAEAIRELERLAATARLPESRRSALAAWIASVDNASALLSSLSAEPKRQVELLKALPLLPDPATRAAAQPFLVETFHSENPEPDLLNAALELLPLTSQKFAARNFALLEAEILRERALPQTVLSLQQLPDSVWNTETPEAPVLVSALRRWLGSVPPQERAGDAFKAGIVVAKKFAALWKKAAVEAEHQLDALQPNVP